MTRSASIFATCGVAALIAFASGCASAPAGKQFVKVDSNPAGATISVNGQAVSKATTPAKLTLDIAKAHQIVVTKPGYRNGTALVSTVGGKSLSPDDVEINLVSSYVPLVIGSSKDAAFNAKLDALVALEAAKKDKKVSEADYKIALKQLNALEN